MVELVSLQIGRSWSDKLPPVLFIDLENVYDDDDNRYEGKEDVLRRFFEYHKKEYYEGKEDHLKSLLDKVSDAEEQRSPLIYPSRKFYYKNWEAPYNNNEYEELFFIFGGFQEMVHVVGDIDSEFCPVAIITDSFTHGFEQFPQTFDTKYRINVTIYWDYKWFQDVLNQEEKQRHIQDYTFKRIKEVAALFGDRLNGESYQSNGLEHSQLCFVHPNEEAIEIIDKIKDIMSEYVMYSIKGKESLIKQECFIFL